MRNFSDKNIKKFQFPFEVNSFCYNSGSNFTRLAHIKLFQFPFEVYCFCYMIDVMKEYMIDIKFQFLFEVSYLCYTGAGTVVFCVVCCKFQLSFEVYCFWYNRRNPLDRRVHMVISIPFRCLRCFLRGIRGWRSPAVLGISIPFRGLRCFLLWGIFCPAHCWQWWHISIPFRGLRRFLPVDYKAGDLTGSIMVFQSPCEVFCFCYFSIMGFSKQILGNISIPLRGFLLLLLQHHGIQQTNTG